MKFAIEHCYAGAAGPAAPLDNLDWPLEALLPHFAHCAQYLPERRINWAQSFARRELSAEAYQLCAGTTDGVHLFKRTARAPRKFPRRVSFRQSFPEAGTMEAHSALQGEVLTYVETCLEIKVERLLSSILTFTPKVNSLLAPDAQGVTWVFDFARASAFLVASTKESRVYFKRELLDGWKPHHSFWRVRSMSAIIP